MQMFGFLTPSVMLKSVPCNTLSTFNPVAFHLHVVMLSEVLPRVIFCQILEIIILWQKAAPYPRPPSCATKCLNYQYGNYLSVPFFLFSTEISLIYNCTLLIFLQNPVWFTTVPFFLFSIQKPVWFTTVPFFLFSTETCLIYNSTLLLIFLQKPVWSTTVPFFLFST